MSARNIQRLCDLKETCAFIDLNWIGTQMKKKKKKEKQEGKDSCTT